MYNSIGKRGGESRRPAVRLPCPHRRARLGTGDPGREGAVVGPVSSSTRTPWYSVPDPQTRGTSPISSPWRASSAAIAGRVPPRALVLMLSVSLVRDSERAGRLPHVFDAGRRCCSASGPGFERCGGREGSSPRTCLRVVGVACARQREGGRIAVSGHSEPWLRDGDQCDGGSWWWGPRSERMGTSANSDFHIRGVSSMARLAGCALMRWSTSTR